MRCCHKCDDFGRWDFQQSCWRPLPRGAIHYWREVEASMSQRLVDTFEVYEADNGLARLCGMTQPREFLQADYEDNLAWNADPETSEKEELLDPALLHEARGYEGSFQSRHTSDTPNW